MARYPHLPAPLNSVPWQEAGLLSKPLFRLRGVQPWEIKVGPRETVHEEENLESMSLISLSEATKGEVMTAGQGFPDLTTTGSGNRYIATYVVFSRIRSSQKLSSADKIGSDTSYTPITSQRVLCYLHLVTLDGLLGISPPSFSRRQPLPSSYQGEPLATIITNSSCAQTDY